MTTIDDIKTALIEYAAIDAIYETFTWPTELERIRKEQIEDSAIEWLRFLLAALERQQAVVAAIAQYAPDDGTSYAQDFDSVQGIAKAALADDGSAQGGG